MRSRSLAATSAIILALVSAGLVGCASSPPPPTVDNTGVEPSASVEATLGIETNLTVGQLTAELEKAGLKVKKVSEQGSGLFIPAKYVPLQVDGAFVQTYRFSSPVEAKGAAATVEAGGYVLGATPSQQVNVNWTGWPAFFRSGDLVVIFVTEKGSQSAERDKRVYAVLTEIFGAPFIGGDTAPDAPHSGSAVPSASTTASGVSGATSATTD